MTKAVDNIMNAAMALSAGERADIATRLIRSLDGPEPTPEEQAGIDESWNAEVARRAAEIDNGTAKLVDGEQFLAKLRRLAGDREARP